MGCFLQKLKFCFYYYDTFLFTFQVDGSTIQFFMKEDFLNMGIALADVYKLTNKFKPSGADRLKVLLKSTRANHAKRG